MAFKPPSAGRPQFTTTRYVAVPTIMLSLLIGQILMVWVTRAQAAMISMSIVFLVTLSSTWKAPPGDIPAMFLHYAVGDLSPQYSQFWLLILFIPISYGALSSRLARYFFYGDCLGMVIICYIWVWKGVTNRRALLRLLRNDAKKHKRPWPPPPLSSTITFPNSSAPPADLDLIGSRNPRESLVNASKITLWKAYLTIFGGLKAVYPQVIVDKGVKYAQIPNGRALKCDIYHHKQLMESGAKGSPLMVLIHGGGWVAGHRSSSSVSTAYHFAAAGWVVANIDYRLANSKDRAKWPEPLTDVRTAIAYMHAIGPAKYGLGTGDQAFTLVYGGSAGAHLAAMSALAYGGEDAGSGVLSSTTVSLPNPPDTRVDALVALYGIFDPSNHFGVYHGAFHRNVVSIGSTHLLHMDPSNPDTVTALRAISPTMIVTSPAVELCPTLLISASHDEIVPRPDTELFASRIAKNPRRYVLTYMMEMSCHAYDWLLTPSTLAGSAAAELWARSLFGLKHKVNSPPSSPMQEPASP